MKHSRCDKCNIKLQYLDNEKNNLTFLICPKCKKVFDDEKYITIKQREEQGYSRYERREEKWASYIHEHYIENSEDET